MIVIINVSETPNGQIRNEFHKCLETVNFLVKFITFILKNHCKDLYCSKRFLFQFECGFIFPEGSYLLASDAAPFQANL